MSASPDSSASRRSFLKEIALASAAVATGVASASPAAAKPKKPKTAPKPPAEKPTQLKLGFTPDPFAAGAVLVSLERGDFVTFPALAKDDSGSFGPIGTAVVELTGCRAKTFSYSTADTGGVLPRFYGELDPGSVYEIKNSTWAAQFAGGDGSLVDAKGSPSKSKTKQKAQPKARPLKHFVFTFFETTFQCVAEGLRFDIRNDPFGLIVADLEHEGLGQ